MIPERGKYFYKVRNQNGSIIDLIYFDVYVAVSPDGGSLPSSGVTADNYTQYLQNQSSILETTDGLILKTIEIGNDSERQICFFVDLGNDESIVSVNGSSTPGKESKSLWDMIKSAFAWLLGQVKDVLTGIFNKLLLSIADCIQLLINAIFGSSRTVTIYNVIFGKIDKLSVNFWEGEPMLKDIVSYWYNAFRGIVMVVYLAMLLYIGIRILLSSTGQSKEKFKEQLSVWATGIIILLFFPYVMRYIVVINDTLVEMIDEGIQNGKTDELNPNDAMLTIREMAEEDNNIALTIVYIIMLGQLIVLLATYYKRVFMVGFLITIFPVVMGVYIWEKSNGSGKSLGTWTKEFFVTVIVQTFHAVVYAVLIDGAIEAFSNTEHPNWVIFILSVTFLFKGEKIIRNIFGIQSSAGTIGDLATAGATAYAGAKAFTKVFRKDSGEKDQDALDKSEADSKVNAARKQQTINAAMNVTNAPSRPSLGGGTTGGATGGTIGGGSPTTGLPSGTGTSPLENLDAAKAYMLQQGLESKHKRGIASKALGKATSLAGRVAGTTLGVTSGLATGSLTKGFSNAVIANEFAGMGTRGIKTIAGYAKNAYKGQRLKSKVRSGAMDDELRKLGFDFNDKFDNDEDVSNAKARIIREALAKYVSASTRGGKAAGEIAYVKSVNKGVRREGDNLKPKP